MKVLVTGVKGQLGYDVVNELTKRGIEAVGVDIQEMDITDAASVEKLDDVAHDHGFVLVVGDENGGQSQLEMDLADACLQFFAQLGVDG